MSGLATLIAAVRTGAAVLAVVLFVFLTGPPGLLWALLTRRPGFLYWLGATGIRTGFVLAGITLRVAGDEHIQRVGAVYACNHSSNIEPPAVFLALRRLFPHLRVLYKAELRRLPVLVWAFDIAGFVPIERANKDQSWSAVDRAAEALRTGHSFFIFPEGTRSRTGDLLPFKKGGIVMALHAQAPIVPVAITGARAAMHKGSPLIWPTTVTVTFLPPVSTAGLTFEDRNSVIARVRESIQSRLAS